MSANSVVIRLSYYQLNSISGAATSTVVSTGVIHSLADQLSLLYGMPVELQLIRTDYLFNDATILATYLSKRLATSKFKATIKSLFGATNLVSPHATLSMPAWLVGVKVVVSGRLTTEVSRPRKTVMSSSLGVFVKEGVTVQASSYTTQNLKGATTVKVWLAHKHLAT